jgi:hypothetical protein
MSSAHFQSNRSEIRSCLHDDAQPPSYSSIFPSLSKNEAQIKDSEGSPSDPSQPQSTLQNHLAESLFQNSTNQPISYEELFRVQVGYSLSNNNLDLNLHENSTNVINQNSLRKQLNILFPRGYLLRHVIFVSLSTLILIVFQTILISNQAVLSNLSAGIWCGIFNFITLGLTISTGIRFF